MVALQILALSVRVRILLSQQNLDSQEVAKRHTVSRILLAFYDSGKAGCRQAPHRSDSEIFFKIEAAKVPVRAKAKAASPERGWSERTGGYSTTLPLIITAG